MKWSDFLHADTNLGKLNVNLTIIGWVCSKMGETLKSVAWHKRFDESSKLIERLLHGDSDWIIFDLTTSLFCILDICWVSTIVVLVKNDVFLPVPIGKILRTWFSKMLLINAWLSVEKSVPCLIQNSKKYEKWPET